MPIPPTPPLSPTGSYPPGLGDPSGLGDVKLAPDVKYRLPELGDTERGVPLLRRVGGEVERARWRGGGVLGIGTSRRWSIPNPGRGEAGIVDRFWVWVWVWIVSDGLGEVGAITGEQGV